MFALFFSLYYSMFRGSWINADLNDITTNMQNGLNVFGKFITSIFNDNATYDTLGTDLTSINVLNIVAFVLALITSIGIVVVAVKGIKRVFGVFFMGIRR